MKIRKPAALCTYAAAAASSTIVEHNEHIHNGTHESGLMTM